MKPKIKQSVRSVSRACQLLSYLCTCFPALHYFNATVFPALVNMRLHSFARLTSRVTFFRPLTNALPFFYSVLASSDRFSLSLLNAFLTVLPLSYRYVFHLVSFFRSLNADAPWHCVKSQRDFCRSKAPSKQRRKDLTTEISLGKRQRSLTKGQSPVILVLCLRKSRSGKSH